MSLIIAFFLLYLNEEDTFFLIVQIFEKFDLKKNFEINMPKIVESCFVVDELLKSKAKKIFDLFVFFFFFFKFKFFLNLNLNLNFFLD
jgi:TBC1 domain family member 10